MRVLLLVVALLVGEAHAQELRLAVTSFTSASADPSLAPLGKGLQSMFTTDLSNIPGLEVVERARLADITGELKLASSGFVDPQTAAKAGELLGATHLLTGSFTLLEKELRLDARLFSVGEGEVVVAESRVGEKELFFDLQKQLVDELVKELAGEVSPKVRVKIQRVHTADWDAFDAYSRGIDAIDTADYDAALDQLKKATSLDEDFDLAAVTLDEASALVAELETKAEALAAVERERRRLDEAQGVADNQRKAGVVVDKLMSYATAKGKAAQRERLTALWFLARGYLNIQRQNAIYIVARKADQFAMERMGEAFAAQYLAEALEVWPAVPVTLDTEIQAKFPLHDTFDEDFAAAVRFLHGEDDREAHRKALRRGLTRLDYTARALRLDQREQARLQAELEPLGRSLPLDQRGRWNQESLANVSMRALDADRAIRLVHELSKTTEEAGEVRDLAEMAEEARRVKEALANTSERGREYLGIALNSSVGLDWATEMVATELAAEPTKRGWELLLDQREWGPEFLWLKDQPTWMIQGRSRAATGPRTDKRRAEVVQWINTYDKADPALLMVGGEPVAGHTTTLRLDWAKGTDHPGPMPKGRPEVWWLFAMQDVDVDSEIVNSKRTLPRPTKALRVRFAADEVTLDRVVESERDSSNKKSWAVLETLDRHQGTVGSALTIKVVARGGKVTVRGDGISLEAKTELSSGFKGAWIEGAGFVELEID